MSQNTVVTITCDYCDTEILKTQTYITSGEYGKDFHEECMRALDNGIISALGIDSLKRVNAGSSRERYASGPNKSYAGPSECLCHVKPETYCPVHGEPDNYTRVHG